MSKTKKCLQDLHLVIFRIKVTVSVRSNFLTKHHGAVSKLVNILISEIWPLTPLLLFTFSLSLLLFSHLNLFFLCFFMVSLQDFSNSKFYAKVFSLAFDDELLEFSFQMRNILLLLEKEIHYCLWLWLFDLRHNNVQTFSPYLLAKDQRMSGSTKLLLCKWWRINKKALDVEAGYNLRLLESYWAKHQQLITKQRYGDEY